MENFVRKYVHLQKDLNSIKLVKIVNLFAKRENNLMKYNKPARAFARKDLIITLV